MGVARGGGVVAPELLVCASGGDWGVGGFGGWERVGVVEAGGAVVEMWCGMDVFGGCG